MTSSASERRSTRRRLSTVASVVGAVTAVVGFALLRWWTLTGPGVLDSGPEQSTTPLIALPPDAGRHHSWVAWASLAVAVVAALLAALGRGSADTVLRVAAGLFAAVGVTQVLGEVLGLHLLQTTQRISVAVDVLPGTWVALAGLMVLGGGSLAGLGTGPRRRRASAPPSAAPDRRTAPGVRGGMGTAGR